MAKVEVRRLNKKFAESTASALRDISFAIADREFVSLLGPSGCGKTTLLRIIAGLESQTSGEIFFDDSEVSSLSASERDIAFVFQSYALYPHFTVEKNISLGLEIRKLPIDEIRRRVDRASETLGLSTLLKRKPKALSGGQMQRVALARALVRDPRVFFLDEPLSNLDAKLRDKTREELKLLFKKAQGTVLYVTHDQTEAMTLSDRIILLKDGCIQQVGTPEQIYFRPANIFVAEFIGSPPMNVLAGSVAREINLECDSAFFGIRPEDISISDVKAPENFEAKVVLRENTGYLTILTLAIGANHQLKAVVPTAKEQKTERLYLSFPAEKIYFFNQDGTVQ